MGESLLDRRVRLGASRSAVAEASGLTVAKVWRVETDGKRTTDDERAAFNKALDDIEAGTVAKAKPRGRPRKTEEGDEGSADADPSAVSSVRDQFARRSDDTYTSVGPSVASIGRITYTTPYALPCGTVLEHGDRVKVKIRGRWQRFEFRRHAVNRDSGAEWLDVYGGPSGHDAIRAFRVDVIVPVRKPRRRTR